MQSNANKVYHNLLQEILDHGINKPPARNQEFGTRELFGETTPMVFDLTLGVPVISTKEIWVRGIVEELLWFLRGETSIKSIRSKGVHIWDDNAYEFYERTSKTPPKTKEQFFKAVDHGNIIYFTDESLYNVGDLGRMYGYQWRKKQVVGIDGKIKIIDPLEMVINKLINSPNSRQIVLNTYDEYDTSVSALPPCHTMPLIFNTTPIPLAERIKLAEEITKEHIFSYNEQILDDLLIPKYYLSTEMTQRSGDVFLGVPFNITSTALLTILIADIVNMVPFKMIHKVSSAHIYDNHFEAIRTQMAISTDIKSYFQVEIVFGEDAYVPDNIIVDYHTVNKKIKAEMVI